MPRRKINLANGEVYHIFNRSINSQRIFVRKALIQYFSDAIAYYINEQPPIKFSIFRTIANLNIYPASGADIVQIYGFAVMPTHFHFLIKQLKERGIQSFIQRLTNSYVHYFNLINERKGPLFESTFKSVHVAVDEQFKHVLRYIDLNPVSSELVDHPADYPHSSYLAHISKTTIPWIDTEFIKKEFGSYKRYEKFVLDNKDYQRSLHQLQSLILE